MILPLHRAKNGFSPVARKPMRCSGRLRRGGAVGALIACLVAAGILGAISYSMFFAKTDEVDLTDLITQSVVKAPFDHVVANVGATTCGEAFESNAVSGHCGNRVRLAKNASKHARRNIESRSDEV